MFKGYREAAKNGYDKGQFSLGNCYYSGIGVAKDNVEALKWYSKAAAQGYENAKTELSKIGSK